MFKKKIPTALRVAVNESRRIFVDPRILIVGMLLVFIYNLVIIELLKRAEKFGAPLNIAESFIAVGNSGVLMLFIPSVFMILISDFPDMGKHSLFIIHRTGRITWLCGMLLSAFFSALSYICIILIFCSILTAKNGFIGTNWSDVATKYGAVFPDERNSFVSEFLPSNLYNQLTFRDSLIHTIVMAVLYLFTLSLIISFFRMSGMRTGGIAAAFGVIACGTVTCSLETDLMWLFPMANTVSWLHYSEVYREPIKPITESYFYFGVLIFIGIWANIFAVKRANISDAEE